MKKFTGGAPAPGAGAQRSGEAPAPVDEAEDVEAESDETEAASVDLKATVTLSGEALAALLEEVKHARKTVPAMGAVGTPIPNTVPIVTSPSTEKPADAAKAEAKPHKADKAAEPSSWWPQGFGQRAKR